MKKWFQGFKLTNFITSLIIGFIYPITKMIISKNKALVFSDTCFIIGLLFSIFGIFNIPYLHGDFDITTFITNRIFVKERSESFKVYKENMNEKRKDSFNYPLLTGIILILAAMIASRLA